MANAGENKKTHNNIRLVSLSCIIEVYSAYCYQDNTYHFFKIHWIAPSRFFFILSLNFFFFFGF